jgi:hypothetical protein
MRDLKDICIFSYWFENENGIGMTDKANANE